MLFYIFSSYFIAILILHVELCGFWEMISPGIDIMAISFFDMDTNVGKTNKC